MFNDEREDLEGFDFGQFVDGGGATTTVRIPRIGLSQDGPQVRITTTLVDGTTATEVEILGLIQDEDELARVMEVLKTLS